MEELSMWPCTHGCADACTHNPVNGKVYLVCVCTYVCVCVLACVVCAVSSSVVVMVVGNCNWL